MKRTERHHLKGNEIADQIARLRELMQTRTRDVAAIAVVVVVVAGSGIGYFVWRERVQSRSQVLLAGAMTVQTARVGPPLAPGTPAPAIPIFPTERERAEAALVKFKAAADAYPATDAGTFARYQQAALLTTLGRPGEAVPAYEAAVAAGGDGIYGQMARLGLAEAQARAGQYDQAINTFKELAQRKDGPLPIDGILMQLGRAYLEAGKRADAQQTFNRLLEEFPESPFIGDARRELDALKKTTT